MLLRLDRDAFRALDRTVTGQPSRGIDLKSKPGKTEQGLNKYVDQKAEKWYDGRGTMSS